MQWYHKDKDPRMDERSARLHARMIKKHLVAQNYHEDVNVARASTYVTWDYDKKKWCEVDHLMFHVLTIAQPTDTRQQLEDRVCGDVAKYLKNFSLYKSVFFYIVNIILI